MSYRAPHPELYSGKKIGTGQCVAFVQEAANAPPTATWTQGAQVKAATSIELGTVIATFIDGVYPNMPHGNHAAIYISHDSMGIRVWDQWVGQPVHQRVIRYKGGHGSASNDGDTFYVVE